MKIQRLLAPFALALAGAAALGAAPASERDYRLAEAYLIRGSEQAATVPARGGHAARLNKLDAAVYNLRRARTVASSKDGDGFGSLRIRIDMALASALLDQAEIYYARRSLSLARKRVDEVLAMNPLDARALALADRIAVAEGSSIYDTTYGTVALQRFVARRGNIGVPLRDRPRTFPPQGTPMSPRNGAIRAPGSPSGPSPFGGRR